MHTSAISIGVRQAELVCMALHTLAMATYHHSMGSPGLECIAPPTPHLPYAAAGLGADHC